MVQMLYDIAFDKMISEDDFVVYFNDEAEQAEHTEHTEQEIEMRPRISDMQYIDAFNNVEEAKMRCSAAMVAKIVADELCYIKHIVFDKISMSAKTATKNAEKILATSTFDSMSEFNIRINADLVSALNTAATIAGAKYADAFIAKTDAEIVADNEMILLQAAEEVLALATKARI